MARIHTVSLTGNGATQNSTAHVLNHHANPFSVSVGVDTNGSTTGYTVQHTFDDPWATYTTDFGTDAVWYDHETLVNKTADDDGNYAFPVTAVRLRLDANGTDVVEMTVIQSGF